MRERVRPPVVVRLLPAGAVLLGAVLLTAAVLRSQGPELPLSVARVYALMPSGSLLRSLVRLDLDSRPPPETAAVAAVPHFPGAAELTYYGFIFALDAWRRDFQRAYSEPLPAQIPLSVDAGRLLGARDAAIFAALGDDGTLTYRVVGRTRGRLRVLRQATIAGTLRVEGGALVEEAEVYRALVWDGRAFRELVRPPEMGALPPGVTWRYSMRSGVVVAQTDTLVLRPRQAVRLAQSGGGPTPIVIPDSRLDVLEYGYRAREPGTYTIRVLLPFTPDDQAFVLRLIVQP